MVFGHRPMWPMFVLIQNSKTLMSSGTAASISTSTCSEFKRSKSYKALCKPQIIRWIYQSTLIQSQMRFKSNAHVPNSSRKTIFLPQPMCVYAVCHVTNPRCLWNIILQRKLWNRVWWNFASCVTRANGKRNLSTRQLCKMSAFICQ